MATGKKKPTKKEPKEIVVSDNGVNPLIQMAIKSKAGVEELKELMKMKYEDDDREAKKEFHKHFCLMQSELPPIKKEKKVVINGRTIYAYAPLETIVSQIKPLLKEYGFSYHWSEDSVNENTKRITCHITGHGHSESSHVDIPIMPASKMTNNIQQAGSASTYGKRYSLSGILGIMVDDDDDGRSAGIKKKANTDKNEGSKDNHPASTKKDGEEAKKTVVDEIKEPSAEFQEKEKVIKKINTLLHKLDCRTIEDAQAKSGVVSLAECEIKILTAMKKRLEDELKEKVGPYESPIEDKTLPFPEGGK